MKFPLLVLFSLCFFACIDEYSDSLALSQDGSAVFLASIYPCEPDSKFIDNVRANYDSIEGLKFDSAWFSQKDSLYSLNYRLFFENLLSWKSNKKAEKDLIGNISLKKMDSTKNIYSFERIININAESEDGAVIPEEGVSPFVLEQISDSVFWEYTLALPPGATLISSEPTDTAYVKQNEKPGILNWKFPAGEAMSKRLVLKAEFSLPLAKKPVNSLLGIVVGCVIMLLAIAMLVRKLKKLSVALKELKNVEMACQNPDTEDEQAKL